MRRTLAFLNRRSVRVIRYIVSIGLVGLFIAGVDWKKLLELRGGVAFPLALGAVFLSGLTYPMHAGRWWLLLRAHEVRLRLGWTQSVTWIGQFYNAFLLGGLGGDAARAFYIYRDAGEEAAVGLGTIALDRVMGLVVLMTLAAAALILRAGALAREPGLRWIFISALVVGGGGLSIFVLLVRVPPARWPSILQKMLGERGRGILETWRIQTRRTPRAHLVAVLLSYIIWLTDIVSIWLLARSVGLRLPFLETCVGVAVAYAATALPISVGGHGVREGALLGVLVLFGLIAATPEAHAAALLLGVLVWATTVFWSLVGGGVLLAAGRLLPAPRT